MFECKILIDLDWFACFFDELMSVSVVLLSANGADVCNTGDFISNI